MCVVWYPLPCCVQHCWGNCIETSVIPWYCWPGCISDKFVAARQKFSFIWIFNDGVTSVAFKPGTDGVGVLVNIGKTLRFSAPASGWEASVLASSLYIQAAFLLISCFNAASASAFLTASFFICLMMSSTSPLSLIWVWRNCIIWSDAVCCMVDAFSLFANWARNSVFVVGTSTSQAVAPLCPLPLNQWIGLLRFLLMMILWRCVLAVQPSLPRLRFRVPLPELPCKSAGSKFQ